MNSVDKGGDRRLEKADLFGRGFMFPRGAAQEVMFALEIAGGRPAAELAFHEDKRRFRACGPA
jgi:hypothetical protein